MKVMLDCIVCPASCHIQVELYEDGKIKKITGNTCRRGMDYAISEITAPVRMVTSTVAVEGGNTKRLPVVTSSPVPKEKIFAVMEQIHKIMVCAPVSVDDIIISDVCGLGVDVVASRSIRERKEEEA
ncbi:DUF1667 domain-containing protein [Lacrimispora sp. NSJ-141]|uniref:DUF1667 domain-containing protein n=1 Tax=Lientehia hominis TaxID=2897778 RepID=A0AAP2RJY1_9FIRM|nr:DUF1667 domain-containing protein [Lientehia hominis]MCD2492995.1 DUF1667 domain-containing protein [Lientehia hominis]